MKEPTPAEQKPPTPGELRRKAQHQEKQQQRTIGRGARQALKNLGYDTITEITVAARLAKAAVDDLNDSLAIAQRMTELLFGSSGSQDLLRPR
jgi:Holliday junction resolvasome RuvABC DNA-binding subunit